MPEHLVPVDEQLSDDLEQYFALTTTTELPQNVRRAGSWRLSERRRRRSAWRAGGGVLGAAAVAGVLVFVLHAGATAPRADSALSSVPSTTGRGGDNGYAAGGLAPLGSNSAAVDGPPAFLGHQGAGGTGASASAPAASAAPAASTAPSIVIGNPSGGHLERSVIAAYTVSPGSFLSSFEDVSSRAVALGGYVASSSTQPDKSGRIVAGTVALKVPAARLTDFLNGMPPGFVASSINFASVDHTAQFVDVTARLSSARAHLDAVNALISKATSLADIATLEREVEAAQIEIDTYQGQLDALNASVDLATATVSLSERGTTVAPPPPPPPVSTGVAAGWDNAVHVMGAIAEGVVTASPVILLALVGSVLLWRFWIRGAVARRRRAA